MTFPRRALLSVSDKSGIEAFGRALVDRGFELLSTGGTARRLDEAGIPVTRVSEVTGHPEILDGRVKTLHPAIHGPLLARRHHEGDRAALEAMGYGPIDVVAVNLYPFRETIARGGIPVAEAMEQVDVGGPTMIRAAAKNHADVYVVVDPADYPAVLRALDQEADSGPEAPGPEAAAEDPPELRRRLATTVFRHVALYDAAIAGFLAGGEEGGPEPGPSPGAGTGPGPEGRTDPAPLPSFLLDGYVRRDVLRYGENPDQAAAFYSPSGRAPTGIAALRQHQGKALSYNNLLDLDGALLSLAPFALSPDPAVSIVKHTTPCGLAIGDTLAEAYEKALRTDPMSAFGSVVACNREVDLATAERMGERFLECLVAPSIHPEALVHLSAKPNLRILTFPEGPAEVSGEDPVALRTVSLPALEGRSTSDPAAVRAARFLAAHGSGPGERTLRSVSGGLLVQTPPVPPFFGAEAEGWTVVTRRTPSKEERVDLAFAWAAIFGVKSNAILLASGGATLGIGAGQMSRVDASVLAVRKAADAGISLEGSVLASDAFFPFRDGVDAAAEAGVRAIIQPGGSRRDAEVIEAADAHDLAMIFTGRRLFRH